ncbi:MAG: hypothetical protein WCJ30_10885, partial [Deltaproteobacteria bacterium]
MRSPGSVSIVLAACIGSIPACATTHLARPVGRGQTRISLSAGGPLAQVGGATIPVPMATVGIAHGLSDAVDVHADFHPFSWIFSPGDGSIGVLGGTMGLAVHPIPLGNGNGRHWLTLGADVLGFTNRLDAELLTNLWIAGSIDPTWWLSLAAGLHNTIVVASTNGYQSRRSPYLPTLFAQIALRPSRRVSIDVEARWYGFSENSVNLVPAYVGLGDLGALGVLFGVHY